MKTKKFLSTVLAFVIALALVFTANYVSADWTAPTTSAPTCPAGSPGCDVPINVGTVAQVKSGGLGVIAFLASGNALFQQDVTVDDLAGTGEREVCADSNGKLIICAGPAVEPNGQVRVSSAYGPSITSVTGIPGFTFNGPANSTSGVITSTHTSAFTGTISVNASGTPFFYPLHFSVLKTPDGGSGTIVSCTNITNGSWSGSATYSVPGSFAKSDAIDVSINSGICP